MSEQQHQRQSQPGAEPSTSADGANSRRDGEEAEEEGAQAEERLQQTPAAAAAAPTPGPRATRLQQLYAQILKVTLSKLSWQNVAGCYPTIAKRAESVLRALQEQMVSQLEMKCEGAFEKILNDREVIAKLNELDGLVGDAAQRRKDAEAAGITEEPTPPHTLAPAAILAAHLHPALAQHQSRLHARLQTTQAQNALLVDEVRRQRAEVEALLAALEDAAADVRGANEVLVGVVASLAEETRLDGEYV